MTSPSQPKPTPIPAVLVYGTPSSPDLTQASWFRAEDKQEARAAAHALKFSVIDIQTEAEKAVTVGIHEGVLKGSGRMIVGSVTTEVYRRIEEYARKAAGGEASPRPATTETAAAKSPVSEQNVNKTAAGTAPSAPPPKVADTASPDSNAGKVVTSSTPATALSTTTDSKPQSAASSAASPTAKPDKVTAAPDPWDALRVGSHVVGKYWLPDGQPDGWWIGVITAIDKNDFIIRAGRAKNAAAQDRAEAHRHPSSDVRRQLRMGKATPVTSARLSSWGGLRVAPCVSAIPPTGRPPIPSPQPQETSP